MEKIDEKGKAAVWRGILTAAALIISSIIIAAGFGRIAKPDRVVNVRGLAEREVDADMAVWPLTFSVGGNNLLELQKDIVGRTKTVTVYLEKHGLTADDYTVQAPAITDTSVNPYMNDNKARYTYIAKQVVLVRSKNVKAVKSAQADSLDLMGSSIAVSQDYDGKVQYEFTGLNGIKPAMIAEATKNARAAAEQFAHDSGSKVGKIKSASQGLFTIDDAATGLEEKKTVRVVTTVEYLLKD
ncbi:MAG TPA: SIMPL domain-containing protein [Treponema sp.]|nr:SIMPL domain-containing protein [Treponema sp.]